MVSGRRSFSAGAGAAGLDPLPPVSSKAKDYTERPEEVVDELDDLRVRGIAKVLNKHFTTTTKQLAIEKAEADAALADLERRRAQTKAFVPSKGGELNPYDQLYLQLQQKRAECRRKERETMLLYQRYVMKYAKSAKADPLVSAPPSSDAGQTQELLRPDSPHKGDPPGKSALGTLDENSEITFTKFYEKQRLEQEQINREKSAKHFESALSKFMTVQEEDRETQQGNGVPELVPSKDSSHPSPVSSNSKLDPFMSAVSKFTAQAEPDEVVEEAPPVAMEEQVQAELEEVAESVKSPSVFEAEEDDNDDETQGNTAPASNHAEEDDVFAIKRTLSEDPPGRDGVDYSAEDESMVSQLKESSAEKVLVSPEKPVQNGHVSATTIREETKIPPATPEVVPEAAAITLSPSSYHSTPKSSKFDVNEAQLDFDDRSIISELTLANSAVTRQLLDEVETEMEDFIKCEMQAIRKMLDSEEDASTIDPSFTEDQSEASSVQLADQSVRVAMKAEAMAREMQKILDDFAKEDAVSTASTPVLDESLQSPEKKAQSPAPPPTSVYPYKFEPAIPGEDWYVHFDDNYQKEFYVERISNKTQWDYPQKMPTPRRQEQHVSSDDFLSDMHSVASSRRSLSRRSSRRSVYRKQRRKRRARRLMISFLALLCVLVCVFYWRVNHPGESMTAALAGFAVSVKNMNLEDFVHLVIDQYEYSFTDRRAKEEEEFKLKKLELERKEKELAAQLAAQRAREDTRRAKEEAERIAKEEAERLAREQEAARQLAAQRAREEAERANEEEAARISQISQIEPEEVEEKPIEIQTKKSRRSIGCNIPFAYVVPHCWRLAKKNPMFGLKSENDLVFLQ
mmetsp:Transcript_22825/g.53910  ORF Transcript_22825/g.53910 Transcript_22825/m.53910 type:complete len:855 (-) Transcript_22825:338-2902(-)